MYRHLPLNICLIVCVLFVSACAEDPPTAPSKSELRVLSVLKDARASDWPYAVLSETPKEYQILKVVLGDSVDGVELENMVSIVDKEVRLRFLTTPDSHTDSLRVYLDGKLISTTFLRIWLRDISELNTYPQFKFMQEFPQSWFEQMRPDTDEVGIIYQDGRMEYLAYTPGTERLYHLPFTLLEDFRFFYYDIRKRQYRTTKYPCGITKPVIGGTSRNNEYGVSVSLKNFVNTEPTTTQLKITTGTETHYAYSDAVNFDFDVVSPGRYTATLEHPTGSVYVGLFDAEDIRQSITVDLGPMMLRMIRKFRQPTNVIDTVDKEFAAMMQILPQIDLSGPYIEIHSGDRNISITLNTYSLDIDFSWIGTSSSAIGTDTVLISLKDVPYTVDSLNKLTAIVYGRDIIQTEEATYTGYDPSVREVYGTDYSANYKAISCVRPEEQVFRLVMTRWRQ